MLSTCKFMTPSSLSYLKMKPLNKGYWMKVWQAQRLLLVVYFFDLATDWMFFGLSMCFLYDERPSVTFPIGCEKPKFSCLCQYGIRTIFATSYKALIQFLVSSVTIKMEGTVKGCLQECISLWLWLWSYSTADCYSGSSISFFTWHESCILTCFFCGSWTSSYYPGAGIWAHILHADTSLQHWYLFQHCAACCLPMTCHHPQESYTPGITSPASVMVLCHGATAKSHTSMSRVFEESMSSGCFLSKLWSLTVVRGSDLQHGLHSVILFVLLCSFGLSIFTVGFYLHIEIIYDRSQKVLAQETTYFYLFSRHLALFHMYSLMTSPLLFFLFFIKPSWTASVLFQESCEAASSLGNTSLVWLNC